jgi:hypothetical protein
MSLDLRENIEVCFFIRKGWIAASSSSNRPSYYSLDSHPIATSLRYYRL